MIVSFSSQKGGAGKTSTTMITATYMNYYFEKKICVVDIDIQKSLFNKRKDEIELIRRIMDDNGGALPPQMKEAKMLKKLKQENKKPYDIIALSFEDTGLIDRLLNLEEKYDVVFIDFPGTLNFQQISLILLMLDYAFIPFYTEEKNFKSAFAFEKVLRGIINDQETYPERSRLKNYYSYFFKFNPNVSKDKWEFLDSMFEKRGIKKLQNSIWENKRIEEDVSTINLISGVPVDKNPLPFVEEVMARLFPSEYEYKNNELIKL